MGGFQPSRLNYQNFINWPYMHGDPFTKFPFSLIWFYLYRV